VYGVNHFANVKVQVQVDPGAADDLKNLGVESAARIAEEGRLNFLG
jgi:hypothetical protein